MTPKNKSRIKNFALMAFFAALGTLFLLSFKRGEHYIYFWDIAGYWTSGLDFTALFFTDIGAAFSRLYESILFDDYTLLPVLLYIPVFKWFSQSNTAFVLTTYLVYGVPFLLMLYWFFVRIFRIETLWQRAAVLFLLFTCTVFLTPLMGGFLDACGLTVVAGILLLLSCWDMTKISPFRCLGLALLVLALCFFRRWYSFWAVAFFPAYFLSLAALRGKSGLQDRTTLKVFANLFLS
ncbi:MAG: hypothetical protein LBU77_05570, partial [Clostridiales bacterium]|nr:hypothetical protein [Clostridiales bacterium]